jgi:hypothetical protein
MTELEEKIARLEEAIKAQSLEIAYLRKKVADCFTKKFFEEAKEK